MTTEEDFQRALDENPDDHLTRLVFADWLQERDDPRAEGYRAMGLRCIRVRIVENDIYLARWSSSKHPMPDDWFLLLPGAVPEQRTWPQYASPHTRQEIEDAAARAFALLPSERRAELLSATPVV